MHHTPDGADGVSSVPLTELERRNNPSISLPKLETLPGEPSHREGEDTTPAKKHKHSSSTLSSPTLQQQQQQPYPEKAPGTQHRHTPSGRKVPSRCWESFVLSDEKDQQGWAFCTKCEKEGVLKWLKYSNFTGTRSLNSHHDSHACKTSPTASVEMLDHYPAATNSSIFETCLPHPVLGNSFTETSLEGVTSSSLLEQEHQQQQKLEILLEQRRQENTPGTLRRRRSRGKMDYPTDIPEMSDRCKPSKRKLTSRCWQTFVLSKAPRHEGWAFCAVCERELNDVKWLRYSSSTGTRSLNSHHDAHLRRTESPRTVKRHQLQQEPQEAHQKDSAKDPQDFPVKQDNSTSDKKNQNSHHHAVKHASSSSLPMERIPSTPSSSPDHHHNTHHRNNHHHTSEEDLIFSAASVFETSHSLSLTKYGAEEDPDDGSLEMFCRTCSESFFGPNHKLCETCGASRGKSI